MLANAKAYINLISAMKGRRIFERFGFNLPPQKPIELTKQLLIDIKK